MYRSRQYLSINPKNFDTPLNAHEHQKKFSDERWYVENL